MNRLKQLWTQFWFEPRSARPLAALRILLASILLAQAFYLRDNVFDFFSKLGFLQGEVGQALSNPSLPQIFWLVHWLAPIGITEAQCIFAVCFLYFCSLIFLLVGFRTRVAAVMTWFLHWILLNSASSSNYGIDVYTHVLAFILMWSPCGAVWSIDSKKNGPETPTVWASLSRRWVQLYLCLTYLLSGIEKAQGAQWRNGEILWRALTLPLYRQFDFGWVAQWPIASAVMTWASLVLEIGYCIFIWPKRTRMIWVVGLIGMHLSIAIFLGLSLFGILMAGLTFCMFAIPDPVALPRSAILFFDGECGICNGFVQFVLQNEKIPLLKFAALQSDFAQKTLASQYTTNLASVVLLEDSELFTKTKAVIRTMKLMGGSWPALAFALQILPQFVRDFGYDMVAKNRYRLMAQPGTCRLPSLSERARFY